MSEAICGYCGVIFACDPTDDEPQHDCREGRSERFAEALRVASIDAYADMHGLVSINLDETHIVCTALSGWAYGDVSVFDDGTFEPTDEVIEPNADWHVDFEPTTLDEERECAKFWIAAVDAWRNGARQYA